MGDRVGNDPLLGQVPRESTAVPEPVPIGQPCRYTGWLPSRLPRLVRVNSDVKKEPAVRPRDRSTMGTNRRLRNPVVTVKGSALMAVPART